MRRSSQLCAALLAAFSWQTEAVAQDKLSGAIDSIFSASFRPSTPGCAVRVVRSGETLLERAYGSADLELGVPISPQSVFDIGSISKQFTAAVISFLASENKLSLDDRLARWIPELPAWADSVTLRHLLTHTSGVRDYVDIFPMAGVQYAAIVRTADAIALLQRQKRTDFPAGARWAYSNSNFMLLAEIARRAGGAPLDQLLQRYIFAPLGMSSTQLLVRHDQVIPGRASSYDRSAEGGFVHVAYNWETVGDGAIQSTTGDLLKWLEALRTGRVGERVLSPEYSASARLTDGQSTMYAFGLNVRPYRGLPRLQHNGAAAGYRADVALFPEQRLASAVLCNYGATNPTLLNQRIADLVLAEEIRAAAASAPSVKGAGIVAPSAHVAVLAGAYFDNAAGVLRTFSHTDSTLAFSAGGPPIPLAATGANEFVLPGRGYRFLFARDSNGSVSLTEVPPGGPRTRFTRMQDTIALRATQLAEYEGRYTSAELDASWRVRQSGDHLRLDIGLDADASDLQQVFRDGFSAPGLMLRFMRDENNRVNGVRVYTRGAQGVLLRRTVQSPSGVEP